MVKDSEILEKNIQKSEGLYQLISMDGNLKKALANIIVERNKTSQPYIDNLEAANSLIHGLHSIFSYQISEVFKEHNRELIIEAEKDNNPLCLTVEVKYKTMSELIFRFVIEYDNKEIRIQTRILHSDHTITDEPWSLTRTSETIKTYDTNSLIKVFLNAYSSY